MVRKGLRSRATEATITQNVTRIVAGKTKNLSSSLKKYPA